MVAFHSNCVQEGCGLMLRFTYVVPKEHQYLFQEYLRERKFATLRARVRFENTNYRWYVRHFIGRLCCNSTWSTPHLRSGMLTCIETAGKFTCVSYENEEPMSLEFRNNRIRRLSKIISPYSEPQIPSDVSCCKTPKSVIPGKDYFGFFVCSKMYPSLNLSCV
jgi:hypothetical protein